MFGVEGGWSREVARHGRAEQNPAASSTAPCHQPAHTELAKVPDEPLTANPRRPLSRCILPDHSLAFDIGHHSAWTPPYCTGHPHLSLPAQAFVHPAASQMPQTPQAQRASKAPSPT